MKCRIDCCSGLQRRKIGPLFEVCDLQKLKKKYALGAIHRLRDTWKRRGCDMSPNDTLDDRGGKGYKTAKSVVYYLNSGYLGKEI